MPRKLTNEEYINRCKEKGLDLPLEPYINATTKIKHKCNKGHIYEQIPYSHLHGHNCYICENIKRGIAKRKTSKEYYQECKERGLDLPVEPYIDNKTMIKHKCDKGHIYKQTPKSHLLGHGCSKCSKNYSYTPEEYYNLCKSKGLDLPIEDYVNTSIKIKHKCSNGHIYLQTPGNHLNGEGCKICAINVTKNKYKKTSKRYIQECKSKGLDLPLERYRGSKVKIKHKCSKGHIYEQEPTSHLQGYGCLICNESHGEKYIRNYLDNNSIKYISQKTFKDLKDKQPLSYDFYLPKQKVLIEYQGIQHFESVSFNGKDYTDLDKQKHHDKLKRAYAKDNGYRLLELHYSLDTQDKVNKYLSRRIKG